MTKKPVVSVQKKCGLNLKCVELYKNALTCCNRSGPRTNTLQASGIIMLFYYTTKGGYMKSNNLPTGITLRKDGRYMWRFKYDGKTYSGYCDKLAKAKKQLNDKRYEVAHGLYSKDRKVSFSAWFNEWIDTYKTADCKISTLDFYRRNFHRYIEPEFGQRNISSLRPEQLQRFVTRMAKNYSKSTASTSHFLLYDSLQQAVQSGIISKNPMDSVTTPKFTRREKKKALTKEQEDKFLEYMKDSRYYPICRMATLTGMRIGEILGLSWSDIDYRTCEIHIRHTLSYIPGKGQYLDTPKSEASRRTIPMMKNGKLYSLLKERSIVQKKERLLVGKYWKPKAGLDDLVFTTEFGTPICDTNIRKEMDKAIARMQEEDKTVPHFSLHTLRHCFATRCIENGMDPKTLQAILGHSSFAVTMDLYCDVMEDTKRREMEKISAVL